MMKSLGSAFVIAIVLLACASGLEAQALRSTITFDNQSGEPTLVKLVGPTAQVVEVPNGEKRTVNVAAGEYYLLARYGADARQYTYSRGDPVKVEETATEYSAITITLHKVVGGNYPSRASSADEFERALEGPQRHVQTRPPFQWEGLMFGVSTRADVQRLLGSPTKAVEDYRGVTTLAYSAESSRLPSLGSVAEAHFGFVDERLSVIRILAYPPLPGRRPRPPFFLRREYRVMYGDPKESGRLQSGAKAKYDEWLIEPDVVLRVQYYSTNEEWPLLVEWLYRPHASKVDVSK